MSHVQTDVLDVVIIGGGLVGGLTALLLAQGGVQATVLDAAPILDEHKTLSVANPRVLALSQATIHLLKTVDVWDKIARQMPYSGMQVWNKMAMVKLTLVMSPNRNHMANKPSVLWLSQVCLI